MAVTLEGLSKKNLGLSPQELSKRGMSRDALNVLRKTGLREIEKEFEARNNIVQATCHSASGTQEPTWNPWPSAQSWLASNPRNQTAAPIQKKTSVMGQSRISRFRSRCR
jgi:hypothetical protein